MLIFFSLKIERCVDEGDDDPFKPEIFSFKISLLRWHSKFSIFRFPPMFERSGENKHCDTICVINGLKFEC